MPFVPMWRARKPDDWCAMGIGLRSAMRPIVLAWCAAVATGCSSWGRSVPPTAQALDRGRRPLEVRVVRHDSTFLVLRDPVIRNDSITGTLGAGADTAVALTELARMEVRRPDALRTGGMLLLILAAVVGTYGLLLHLAYAGAHT